MSAILHDIHRLEGFEPRPCEASERNKGDGNQKNNCYEDCYEDTLL